jgi:hypothetical protein
MITHRCPKNQLWITADPLTYEAPLQHIAFVANIKKITYKQADQKLKITPDPHECVSKMSNNKKIYIIKENPRSRSITIQIGTDIMEIRDDLAKYI